MQTWESGWCRCLRPTLIVAMANGCTWTWNISDKLAGSQNNLNHDKNLMEETKTSLVEWQLSNPTEKFSGMQCGDFRFLLCFEIPQLRQLVFPKRVSLLEKWDHAMNITIWRAWRCALLKHIHAQKNDKVSATVCFRYLPPVRAGTTASTHHMCKPHSWPTQTITELTPTTPELPDERFMVKERILVLDQVTRGYPKLCKDGWYNSFHNSW